ncbi:MAG: zinc-binding dehydrogenase [Anaerolineae bacterium]|nr:zinc-binding dehydrogenase [Anaerolineae bacterium]
MKDRRIVFPGSWQAQWEDIEIPDRPEPGRLLVEATLNVINYGTVMAIYTGTHININKPGVWPSYPHYPSGHTVGVVRAVGEGVEGYRAGDRVAFGGEYSRFHVLDLSARRPLRIPEGVSDLEAVVAAHASISLNGIRLARTTLGERAIVFGAGIIGLSAALYALAAGAAPVVVVDPLDSRLEIARDCGVDYTLNPERVDVEAEARALTEGNGFEVVIEGTGVPTVLTTALRVAGRMGRVVILGSPRGTVELDTYNDIHRGGISVIGAHSRTAAEQENSYYPWTTQRNIQAGWELIKHGRLSFARLVTHRIKGAESADLFEHLAKERDKYLGVVMEWGE